MTIKEKDMESLQNKLESLVRNLYQLDENSNEYNAILIEIKKTKNDIKNVIK